MQSHIIESLNPKKMPEVDPETEYQLQKLDDNFQNSLCKMIVRRYLVRWFVPLPIRAAITVFRGLMYVTKGLSTLADGRLTVEVLDGAAIGASMLQKNYDSAGMVMFLLGVSGLLEDYTKARTRTALTGSLAVIYLGIGGKLAGALGISDPPREEAAVAIRRLREAGIPNVVMLTDLCK